MRRDVWTMTIAIGVMMYAGLMVLALAFCNASAKADKDAIGTEIQK